MMNLDWKELDRWLFGEAWTGTLIPLHADMLCDTIGPRWSSSEKEHQAVTYIKDQFRQANLNDVQLEPFELDTWAWDGINLLDSDGVSIRALPFNRCPACHIQSPLVDVGYGTHHERHHVGNSLQGAMALMHLEYEPFTTPIPIDQRLNELKQDGAQAVIVIDRKRGGRMEYHNAGNWREPETAEAPLPVATISRESAARIRRQHVNNLTLEIKSRFYTATSHNVTATLPGKHWPDESLVLGGHHDTVYGVPGGNDNASGTIAVMETARVLAKLRENLGIDPGMTIRFATFSGEEQRFQGSIQYVRTHCGQKPAPRLAINLDELSTGHMKGLVLAFPHLREFIQQQFDHMNEDLVCHVMAQYDATSDHFPFLRAGIDTAHVWRWRFHGRHPDSDYHHEQQDTRDKLNVRELREYVAQLTRLILRLSHVSPENWPRNPVTKSDIQEQLSRESGQVIRVS